MPSPGEMIGEEAPFGFASDGVFGLLFVTSVVCCQIFIFEGFSENSPDDREKA